jgi:hypothetical protein
MTEPVGARLACTDRLSNMTCQNYLIGRQSTSAYFTVLSPVPHYEQVGETVVNFASLELRFVEPASIASFVLFFFSGHKRSLLVFMSCPGIRDLAHRHWMS